ncbi:hypothetical protein ABEB36_014612 [Hypothenemus hampei]|uniref:C2H2-type domain-containing protein n=1 Tax=Hypothenemus hampei TaxID=57062 RepID=A0ABD1E6Y4_HYPHA
MNATTIGYWDLSPHLTDSDHVFENKPKLCYQSAMCLINPKQDPPIFNHNESIFTCTPPRCSQEPTGASTQEERFLKFVNSSETIEVEVESRKTLSSQTLIRERNKYKSEERPYKCERPDCHKTFLLKHHLTTHEKTHTGERPHVCIHCGKSFTHKYCLNTHLLLHTKERPHQCTECNKRFTLKHHLMSHINVHKRDKPFVCQECGKSFPLRKQLITHEKFHRGERPYVCKECGDTFAQENHLVMHLRFHGSLNSFKCNDCGATFTRKFELDNHERLHGKEPLICSICNKEFLQKRTLMTHMKSHENKTQCRYCGEHFPIDKSVGVSQTILHFCNNQDSKQNKKITSSAKLKLMPKVTKNKKYFCDVCFRKFGSKHGLTQHKKRQHNIGGNLFSCHICNKSFREKADLLVHKHNL